MRDPEFHEDGTIREITRIEFEPLFEEGPLFRWTVWSNDVRMQTEVGKNLHTLIKLLEATGILVGGMPYIEEIETPEERKRREAAIAEAAKRLRGQDVKACPRQDDDPIPRKPDSLDRGRMR